MNDVFSTCISDSELKVRVHVRLCSSLWFQRRVVEFTLMYQSNSYTTQFYQDFNILTGQKLHVTELKSVWPVNMTGNCPKIILSPGADGRRVPA